MRLLGLLCHENKAVQDRVRLCGGVEAVMNLCVVDERNPCKYSPRNVAQADCISVKDLREHAIFTLHNLLKDNAENQKVVSDIQPMGQWDGDGVLQDKSGSIRK